MDQETRWLKRYDEVKNFIEENHRNPSKHRIEEHDMLNWVKQQRKLMKGERSLHVGRDDRGKVGRDDRGKVGRDDKEGSSR